MEIELEAAVTVLTGLSIVGVMLRNDRKRSREIGERDKEFKTLIDAVADHDDRIDCLEEQCLSIDKHEKQTIQCRGSIMEKISENHNAYLEIKKTQADGEIRRVQAREEDNKWKLRIEVMLARIAQKLGIPENTTL